MTQIAVSGVAVEFGSTTLLGGVSFTVAAGEKWGVVGRNGTGKTTLFNLVTGASSPTRGSVTRAPGMRIAALGQHRDFGNVTTPWEAVAGALGHLLELERSLGVQATSIADMGNGVTPQALDRYARDLERFEREGGYEITARVDAVLHGLGFDPVPARTQRLDSLSGGERGRIGLARQLVAPADVLLLDEPTNHLDLDTTEWLERYLVDTKATVLFISHDRAFLATVADHILHLENGTAVPYVGGYESFIAQRAERRLTQRRAFDRQQRFIAEEEDYIRRNMAGQNTRQAKGRRKRLERLPRLGPPPDEPGALILRLEESRRGGDQVVTAEGLCVAVGGRVLIDGFTAQVRRGDRIGVVGPNGAGKSMLLRTIVGEVTPVSGVVRVGASITVAYYRQDLAQVPTDRSLYDVIADLRPAWERGQVHGHLGRFGFSGDDVLRRADTLSGGELARIALAMMALSQANLLILDEPTNHLDVESIEAMEDAIERYQGTVILVSHDRALLRALVSRVWVLHEARIATFDGTFAEWEQVSAERAHAAAIRAAEEEAVHRLRERQRLTQRDERANEQREALRHARRAADQAEQAVTASEARIAELTAALSDPALYTTPDGVIVAGRLGTELESAKAALDRAIESWTVATERAEALSASAAAGKGV